MKGLLAVFDVLPGYGSPDQIVRAIVKIGMSYDHDGTRVFT